MWLALEWLTAVSAVGFALTLHVIPKLRPMFIKANIYGIDLNKKKKEEDGRGNVQVPS